MHFVAFLLLIIGGLNWLLVGVFGWDISALWGGMDSWISRIIYILIGLAAIYEIIVHKGVCKVCVGSNKAAPAEPVAQPEQPQQPEQMNSEQTNSEQ